MVMPTFFIEGTATQTSYCRLSLFYELITADESQNNLQQSSGSALFMDNDDMDCMFIDHVSAAANALDIKRRPEKQMRLASKDSSFADKAKPAQELSTTPHPAIPTKHFNPHPAPPAIPYWRRPRMQINSLVYKDDIDTLDAFHCYLRTHMVEIFEAGLTEINEGRRQGGHVPALGQIGIRCRWCSRPCLNRARWPVLYPKSVDDILPSVGDLQVLHFGKCGYFPRGAQAHYNDLRKSRPYPASVCQALRAIKFHWASRAKAIGLVDAGGSGGVRFDSSKVEK